MASQIELAAAEQKSSRNSPDKCLRTTVRVCVCRYTVAKNDKRAARMHAKQ